MEPVRILIVDDDIEALRLVGIMLEREGFQILAAASGRQAIGKAVEEQPDLIILDVMMPEMDGYQVATQLRKHPTTEHIPILMFTAKSGVNDKVTGFQSGADDFLIKPVHPAELTARIKALLQRKHNINAQIGRGQIISFLPSKGGLGNSSLALNTAIEFKRMHEEKRSILVELCAGRGTLALQLGMSTFGGIHTLAQHALSTLNKEQLADNIARHASGIDLLLSTSEPRELELHLTRDFTYTILRFLSVDYDYVLLDLPAALDAATMEALRMSHEIILTLDPNRIGLTLAQTMLKSLQDNNIDADKFKLVLIHRAPATAALSRLTIEDSFQHPMICSIPSMPDLAYESAQGGKPMVTLQPHGLIAQQVRLIVQSIVQKS